MKKRILIPILNGLWLRNDSKQFRSTYSSCENKQAEPYAILLAKNKKYSVLIDDLAARRFAAGLGIQVVGSIGVLIRSAKMHKISKIEALDALDKLGRVMWLSIDVYEDARKIVEEM